MGCFVVAGFVLRSMARGPSAARGLSAIEELLVLFCDPKFRSHQKLNRRKSFTQFASYDVNSQLLHSQKGKIQKVYIFPYFYTKAPQKGHEYAFSIQRCKLKLLCIVKTTKAILTKFCTKIKTTKYSLWVIPNLPHKSKMVDGRHLEKTYIAMSQQWFDSFLGNLHTDAY